MLTMNKIAPDKWQIGMPIMAASMDRCRVMEEAERAEKDQASANTVAMIPARAGRKPNSSSASKGTKMLIGFRLS